MSNQRFLHLKAILSGSNQFTQAMMLIAFLAISTTAFAQPRPAAEIEGAVGIELFGEGGAGVPTFLGSAPPKSFFNAPLNRSLVEMEDFYASFAMEAVCAAGGLATAADQNTFLKLSNFSGINNDVVISVASPSRSRYRRFLVRLTPDQDLQLDIHSLTGFDTLYVTGQNDFQATVQVDGGAAHGLQSYQMTTRSSIRSEEANNLRSTEPTSFGSKSSSNCSGPIKREMKMYDLDDNYILSAYFHRYNEGFTGCPDSQDRYTMDVYWPGMNDLHADGNGSSIYCSSNVPECTMFGYSTTTVADPPGNTMLWRSYAFYTGTSANDYESTFDHVYFTYGVWGISYCRDIHPTGVDCLGPNADDFKFKVKR